DEVWHNYHKYGIIAGSTAVVLGALYYWKYGLNLPSWGSKKIEPDIASEVAKLKSVVESVLEDIRKTKTQEQTNLAYLIPTEGTSAVRTTEYIFDDLPEISVIERPQATSRFGRRVLTGAGYLKNKGFSLATAPISFTYNTLKSVSSNIWQGIQSAGRWAGYSVGFAIGGFPLAALGYTIQSQQDAYLGETFNTHDFAWFMHNKSKLSAYAEQLHQNCLHMDYEDVALRQLTINSIVTAYDLVIQEIETLLAFMDFVIEKLDSNNQVLRDRAYQVRKTIELLTNNFYKDFNANFTQLVEKNSISKADAYTLAMVVASFVDNIGTQIKSFLPLTK
ncbi:MAG TPA: hypothetical protein VHA52_03240, partial [Candidatus Babeliaceae bacterium]|nr:hypothetical protein [Candidatus Babeliaceae bacterium]